MPEDEQVFTVQSAADFLQVREDKVLELIHDGHLEASNINPNGKRPRWRIPSTVMGKFLLKTRHQAPAAAPKVRRAKSTVKDYFA